VPNNPPTIPAASQLLTVRDVAAMLKIHPRTVWRMSATGEIPAPLALAPKTIRWQLRAIEAHIAKLVAQAEQVRQ
jgi:predicted DNA-binding transcriptional regulator AlpA